jgi:hypothetical protein
MVGDNKDLFLTKLRVVKVNRPDESILSIEFITVQDDDIYNFVYLSN